MDADGNLTLLTLEQKPDFVETGFIQNLVHRALMYIRAGYPVHFTGPPGAGKTAVAMHVAAQLGREVILIQGEDAFASADLVGENSGYRSTQMIDNFVHSVVKKEHRITRHWVDNRLTSACRYGYTLIYDEFTRSRPETNNVLLSVLEERLLTLPGVQQGERYLPVHPNFAAIFTSNPEEYAGVHKTQDALLDRMITLKLDHHDEMTEVAITRAKSGIGEMEARAVVGMVRELRQIGRHPSRPTIRACIMLGRLVALRGGHVDADDEVFRTMCADVMNVATLGIPSGERSSAEQRRRIDAVVRRHCSSSQRVPA